MKEQSPPPIALCLFFSLVGRKEEKEPKTAKKETVTAPIPQISIILGDEEVGQGETQRVEKGPKLLVEGLKSFHFYSNIIHAMRKSFHKLSYK